MNQTITPWEVKGEIDYNKLIKEFGVSKIDKKLLERLEKIAKKKNMKLHHFLTREIFIAHRDLDFFLNEYEKGNKVFLYTGRGPSGEIHLGHAIPLMFTKYLQDLFDADLYFQFTDDEKFLFKKDLEMDKVSEYTKQNMLDVIAFGFDPKKTHFIIDTVHANLLYPEAIKVAKKITFSTVKAVFGFTNETNIGSIFFTSMQAVPAFLPCKLKNRKMACLIPHAIDQDPHFRVTRDILPKLGYYKPSSIQCRFLPGLQGIKNGKMSSSEGFSINMSDDPKTVKNKINKYAFSGGKATLEEHRKHGGNPDIDVSYQWLVFFEPDDKKLKKVYDDYRSGKLLSGELKAILIEKINQFLKEHQEKRKRAEKQLDSFVLRV
ncbi:MAG: tryptophan--tRNA ligase [Candidatus Nanoarchaeia archaeon]|nr:tryptophan--tRNA ligase [Candidatus Nanoarchaeia archaeon]